MIMFLGSLSLVLVAIILFTLGIRKRLKVRYWQKASAIVVQQDGWGLGYPKPIVRYEVEGIQYEVQSTLAQKPPLQAGKKVQVYYEPKNPENMVIDTFMQRGSFYILMGFIFLLFFLSFSIAIFAIDYYLRIILEVPQAGFKNNVVK